MLIALIDLICQILIQSEKIMNGSGNLCIGTFGPNVIFIQ